MNGEIDMDIFALKKAYWVRILVIVFICISCSSALPIVAHAQTAAPGTQAATQQQNTGGGCGLNPFCYIIRPVAVAGSMAIIYLTGWILSIAGVLMNASLEFTIGNGQAGSGFDAQIYSRIQGGVEAVWTAFRDIANIVIIGMFTFIALTMILGVEKFNARQMVAKVLLVAVLINFSLLFTRVIIESSNFVASQFYKAAQFGIEPSSTIGLLASPANATGISGKFGQLLGVTSVLQTGEALWKTGGSSDFGLIPLALGMLTAVVMIAAALMFFYIAFLLIARAVLFIFLLLTSSLAFASYLIPGSGAIGGYGWDAWWKSLLKNAVFAPLLLMFLWATIQVGTNIKTIAGDGTLGGLLADPAKAGNIGALFSYLLILGMLYVSIKVSSSFAHKIGGFNYAALAPAYGAGLLGRLGGFLSRQTVGRGALRISENLQKKSQDQSRSMFARQLYDFSSQRVKGVAKRDFNLMQGKFGAEIQNAAGIKKLDSIAGKAVKGFEGSEKARAEAYAEQAGRMKLSDDDLKKMRRNAADAIKAETSEGHGKDRKDAQTVLAGHEKTLKDLEASQKKMADNFNALSNNLAKARADAIEAGRDPSSDPRIRRLAAETARHESDMRTQATRIERARENIKTATGRLQNAEDKIQEQVASIVKDAPALAKEAAHNRFSNTLFRIANLSTPKNDKLAKLAEKAVGEKGKKQRLKDLAAAIEEGSGTHKPETPSAPAAPDAKPH